MASDTAIAVKQQPVSIDLVLSGDDGDLRRMFILMEKKKDDPLAKESFYAMLAGRLHGFVGSYKVEKIGTEFHFTPQPQPYAPSHSHP